MAHQLPFVSVIIPTRNRVALLTDCLDSLLVQDYPFDRYEIVVVNDGSTDTTAQAVRGFEQRSDPRVGHVYQEAGGLNVARNTGIRTALGDPVIFVDDDIKAPPSWLHALVSGCLRHPVAGCVGGPIRLLLEGRAPRLCGREPLGETELDLGSEDQAVRAVWGTNMAVRRFALERIGLFNPALSGPGDEEEWERRLIAAGGRIVYIADAWLWHRRLQEELRLQRLLVKRFRRGVSEAAFCALVGDSLSIREELVAIVRSMGHALLRQCTGGLLTSSVRLGRAWGAVRAGR